MWHVIEINKITNFQVIFCWWNVKKTAPINNVWYLHVLSQNDKTIVRSIFSVYVLDMWTFDKKKDKRVSLGHW